MTDPSPQDAAAAEFVELVRAVGPDSTSILLLSLIKILLKQNLLSMDALTTTALEFKRHARQ